MSEAIANFTRETVTIDIITMNGLQKSIHVFHLVLTAFHMRTSRSLTAILLLDEIVNEIASTNKRIIMNDDIRWRDTSRMRMDQFPTGHYRLEGIITNIDGVLHSENTTIIESMTVNRRMSIKAIMIPMAWMNALTPYDIGSCRPFITDVLAPDRTSIIEEDK